MQTDAHSIDPAPDASDPFDEGFQKRLEYLAIVAKRMFRGRTRANRRSSKAGSGVEFSDFRQYAPGDDFRYIDWNAYGRMERLLLRLYEEEEDLSVYVLIDRSRSMGVASGQGPTKLFQAKRLAGALAYMSLHHLDRVSVVGLGDGASPRLPPTRGRQRIFAVLDFLRRMQCDGSTDLSAALGQFTAQHKRRGVAIVLSDLFDPQGFERGLDKLRFARFETQVLQLFDPAEAEPDLRGELSLHDAESGGVRDVTVTPRVLARYRAEYAAYQERVKRYCGEKQIPLARISTRTPADEAVVDLLRRGGMVG